jgi:hypothetical protein
LSPHIHERAPKKTNALLWPGGNVDDDIRKLDGGSDERLLEVHVPGDIKPGTPQAALITTVQMSLIARGRV